MQTSPNHALQNREPPVPLAIVGMSCRFPGGSHADAYHHSLIRGDDLFSPPPRGRWAWCANDRITVENVAAISDIFDFDNALFRLSPREAETIDPHQRLMLEEVWRAIEHAGYVPDDFRRKTTGVFVAMYNQDFQFYARAGEWDEISRLYLATGSAHSMVPNRVSYVFDFCGPSEVVDTACSSALVAVHRAAEAIRNGECEQAVVGGVSLLLEPSRLLMLQELGLLNLTGTCAPFDLNSGGQILGEGVAALVIKPLDQAARDRDTIHAVIRGSGVNHQGATSGGLTRPSAAAQADLIRRTYQRHAVDLRDVGYVEAHGNGGGGDLSELLAFQASFPQPVHVGSVKGNIGFLEAAGGLSQIIKVVMAMKHGMMPATRSHRDMLEDEDLRPDSCRVVFENTSIESMRARAGQPFVAGVHAYGLGGCNAHIILAEPPRTERTEADAGPLPILLSGATKAELSALAAHVLDRLGQAPLLALEDISYSLAVGRPHQNHRVAFAVASKEELVVRLAALAQDVAADIANPHTGDHLREAMDKWISGDAVNWQQILPAGTRAAVAPRSFQRRHFPLPPIAAQTGL